MKLDKHNDYYDSYERRSAYRYRQNKRRKRARNQFIVIATVCVILAIAVITGICLAVAGSNSASVATPDTAATPPNSTDLTTVPVTTTASPTTTVAPTKPNTEPNESPEVNPTSPLEPIVTADGRTLDPNKPFLALTFDDGPSTEYTEKVLKILQKYNARATFFVVGSRAENNPDILKDIVNAGCQIGNHTMAHSDLTDQSSSAALAAVEDVNDIIYDATGVNCHIVRPPYGSFDDSVCSTLSAYPLILWDVDTNDWRTGRTKSDIVDCVMDNAHTAAVVLMHDIHKVTMDSVEDIVKGLTEKGYQLVTIDEVYALQGIELLGGTVHN